MRFLWCFAIVGIFFVFLKEISCLGNPYKILDIEKKATLAEIKKAYKQKAKEW